MFSMKLSGPLAVMFLLLLTSSQAFTAEKPTIASSAKDKCAVCGMFVSKYPAWSARVGFKDSTYAWFDGPKDLFAYLFNLKKYNPGQSQPTVSAVMVKDYYTLKAIDGRKAFYVIGSDVYGPMGQELVPFEKMADAQGFSSDHKGKKILRYGEITPVVIDSFE
jgi:copper chaperone NosL